MPPDEESSLAQVHRRARQLLQQLDTLQSSSDTYGAQVKQAIAAVEECKRAVDRVSLFSPNETLDDLTTSSLRYLSLDRELGDLLQKDQPHYYHHHDDNNDVRDRNSSNSSSSREESLRRARHAYFDYLQLVDQYGLLAPPDRKLLARATEEGDRFSVVGSADPTARRAAKIARLKDEKALKAQLERLRQNSASLAADDDDDDGDDEVLRKLRLAELQLGTMAVFQSLDMIGQELRILAEAPTEPAVAAHTDPRQRMAEDGRMRSTLTGGAAGGGGDDGYSERLDPSLRSLMRNGKAGPILDARGKPMQPFTLLDKRQDFRQGVFRSGHRLPTMTIDEYLEEERRRGGIIEGGGDRPPVEPNEDDLEAADRETMKQREWDEFKEENPKGSGNTINRG